jgi:signal transduction histidine kinase
VAGAAYFDLHGTKPDLLAYGLAGYAVLMVVAQLRFVPIYRRLRFVPVWTAQTTSSANWGRPSMTLFGRLEASFEAQRHFVANASHELRTPLAGLQTLLEVALADPNPDADTLRSVCQEALTLSQHQQRLIQALLTLATSERGVEQWEPLDLAQIAETVLAQRSHEAERRGIHIDATLVPARSTGDPRLVELLLTNLVDNALRHNTTTGQMEVSTIAAQGRSTITVSNTGPTIPPDEVERLFRPFQQRGRERVRHADGHGLGLAIVQAIAQAHRAKITARPRREGGFDIDVSFPPSQATDASNP